MHLKGQDAPQVIPDLHQNPTAVFYDDQGEKRSMRLLSWISGRVWSQVNPYTKTLRYRLGVSCGSLTQRLQSFDHPYAHRYFEWDLAQGEWVEEHLSLFNKKQKASYPRFSEDEISEIVSHMDTEVTSYTAKKGTVILADVRGLHRGMPIEEGLRYAVTNYYVHSNDEVDEYSTKKYFIDDK